VKKFVASDPLQAIAPYQIYFTVIDGKAKKGDKAKIKMMLKLIHMFQLYDQLNITRTV
jgi:hypothetical protein